MKAERRHDLQENTLARVLQNLPIAARLYADKILLVVVILLFVIYSRIFDVALSNLHIPTVCYLLVIATSVLGGALTSISGTAATIASRSGRLCAS